MPYLMRRQIIRSSQTAFTVSVAAIITNNDNQVLLLDHVLRIGSEIIAQFVDCGLRAGETSRGGVAVLRKNISGEYRKYYK